MNKILSFFGLVRIKRAMELTAKLHLHYVKCIVNEIQKDFGAPAVSWIFQDAETWWNEEFTEIMKLNADEVIITQKPEFVPVIKNKE